MNNNDAPFTITTSKEKKMLARITRSFIIFARGCKMGVKRKSTSPQLHFLGSEGKSKRLKLIADTHHANYGTIKQKDGAT